MIIVNIWNSHSLPNTAVEVNTVDQFQQFHLISVDIK